MKILITGITGLVGSFIAKKMLADGHMVFGLVRENADTSLIKPFLNQINLLEGDILDILNLEKAIEGKDWVIHCAGLVSFAPKDRDQLFKVNTEGTANVVNLCIEKNINKLIFISSVAAIGRNEKLKESNNQVITEENDWVESSNNSNYAKSKYLAELEVWRGISEGLPAVILNPSNILGYGDWQKSSTKLFKYVYDQNLFYTAGTLNFVDVEDISSIVSKLLNSDIINERYIVSSGAIEQINFFTEIAKNFKKSPPKYKLSGWAIDILWRLEAIKSTLLGNDPLITKETAKAAKTHFVYDNSKVKKALGFDFKTLSQSCENICLALLEKYSEK
jgi:dihydroflavonol-4-reductase